MNPITRIKKGAEIDLPQWAGSALFLLGLFAGHHLIEHPLIFTLMFYLPIDLAYFYHLGGKNQ